MTAAEALRLARIAATDCVDEKGQPTGEWNKVFQAALAGLGYNVKAQSFSTELPEGGVWAPLPVPGPTAYAYPAVIVAV